MKALVKILIAVVVVLVVGVVAAFLARNVIAGVIIPSVASSTLGVKVELGSADLDMGTPGVTLTDLDIGNPEGFTPPYALKLGTVSVKLAAAESSTRKLVVDEVLLDKVGIWFVQNGETNNIAKITEGLQSEGGSTASSDSQVEIVIKRMVLSNMEVHAMLGGVAAPPIMLTKLELTNISTKGSAANVTEQLTAKIFEVTMQATINACGKELPGAITASVGKSLEGAGVAIGNATAAMGDAAKKAADEAGKALGDAAKGLGDMFGGKKD